jgi:hypothetical protein
LVAVQNQQVLFSTRSEWGRNFYRLWFNPS